MVSTTRLITLATLIIPLASATFSFNITATNEDGEIANFTIPASWGVSDACVTAYAAELPCDKNGLFQIVKPTDPLKVLEEGCTYECIDGFRKWRDTLRAECSETDIEAATSQLTDIGFSVFDSEGPMGATLLAGAAGKNLPVVEMMYWSTCTRDLNNGRFCILEESYSNLTTLQYNDTSLNTPEGTADFCKNSCLTQASVFTYDISGVTYGTDDIFIANVAVLCPDLDTSNYPAILSQKPFSSYSFVSSDASTSTFSNSSNSSDTATGTGTGTSTNGTASEGENAAGSLKGSFWGMGSAVAAVIVAVFMI